MGSRTADRRQSVGIPALPRALSPNADGQARAEAKLRVRERSTDRGRQTGGALPACSAPRRAADRTAAQPFPPGLGHRKNYRDGGNETAPQGIVSARPL